MKCTEQNNISAISPSSVHGNLRLWYYSTLTEGVHANTKVYLGGLRLHAKTWLMVVYHSCHVLRLQGNATWW